MSPRESFLSWARGAHVPVTLEDPEPLGRVIGDARVVALSEAMHGAAEPLEFRNRLLQYLVARHAFTAIAIESGVMEGRLVHDYVVGGDGNLDDVLSRGLSWGFDRLPQNRSLVQWLRQYNGLSQVTRKVNFYGFDAPRLSSRGESLHEALCAEEVRDRAQAENIEWILQQEGSAGRVLMFAHRYHLSNVPVTRTVVGNEPFQHRIAGSHLKRRLGRQLLTIGNLVRSGEIRSSGALHQLEWAAPDSIDGFVAGIADCFVLDLRAAPEEARFWLDRTRSCEHPGGTLKQSFSLQVGKAFDVLLYMSRVTPAVTNC